MTVDKIIEALRCTSAPGGPIEDCGKCPFLKTKKLTTEQAKQLGTDNWTSCDIDRVGMEAADRLANDQIYIAALQKEIEKLRGQLPRWIPVEERLPENFKKVLCWGEYFRYGDFNAMFADYALGYQINGNWGGEVTNGTKARALAWMPLPEPPEVVK